MEESKPKKQNRNIPIDIDIYRQFKKVCDEHDLFVKRECQKLLKAYVEQHTKVASAKKRPAKTVNQ